MNADAVRFDRRIPAITKDRDMQGKSRYLLPIIGIFCAALLAVLALSVIGQSPLPDSAKTLLLNQAGHDDNPMGPARILIGLALLAGLVAMLLARYYREDLDQLNAEKGKVEIALNALPDAVIQLDPQGRPNYLNPSAEAMLGVAIDGMVADQWHLIDRETRQPQLEMLLARAGRDELARVPANARLINRYGLELEVEGLCQPLRDAHGQITGYLLQLRDVTEEREWRSQQPDLWDRDPTSALPGRGFLENRLNRAMQSKRIGDLPMSYLYVSASGIHAAYDELGATAGDALIRHIAALLRAHVRDTDLVARMDREAFAVLLTNCPAEISQRIASGLRTALADFRFEWNGRHHPVTIRLGQIDMPPFEGSLDELLAAASAK